MRCCWGLATIAMAIILTRSCRLEKKRKELTASRWLHAPVPSRVCVACLSVSVCVDIEEESLRERCVFENLFRP